MSAWAAAPAEFWNGKKPEEWTEDERKQLLTRSPWAREPEVNFDSGPGMAAPPRSTVMNRRGRAIPSDGGSAPAMPDKFPSVVRWESALPVREANRNLLKDDPAGHYIVSVNGDLPMLGRRSNDETEDDLNARAEMLKEYTHLEKRGGPIYLVKLGYMPGPQANAGTLFYFERNDLITLHEGTVTFVTRLGPLRVKCKFPLKEMVYQGKLEL